jgi:hypothetical protein
MATFLRRATKLEARVSRSGDGSCLAFFDLHGVEVAAVPSLNSTRLAWWLLLV